MFKELYFSEIDSTNKFLKEHYNTLENFTFARADYQTLGKGRNDRVWNSNKGENLLFSLLIKDAHLVNKGGLLSLLASIGVAKSIEELGISSVSIKWPNDVYIGDKKVCGILLEGQVPNYIVIGIGLNVNQDEFVGEYRTTPTSLKIELGKFINLDTFKENLYSSLISSLTKQELDFDYFDKHNFLNGKMVKFIENSKEFTGKIVGIDNFYNLIIEVENKKHIISSGEIDVLSD